MSLVNLILKECNPNPICPYCHDIVDSGSVYICDCKATYHDECLFELGECAILGCEKLFSEQRLIKSRKNHNVSDDWEYASAQEICFRLSVVGFVMLFFIVLWFL